MIKVYFVWDKVNGKRYSKFYVRQADANVARPNRKKLDWPQHDYSWEAYEKDPAYPVAWVESEAQFDD